MNRQGIRGVPVTTTDLRRYVGRTALVTGAGSGIGLATARRLSLEGAHVVCLDLDPELAAVAVGVLEASGGTGVAATADVADRADVEAVMDVLAPTGLDLLANVAGIARTVDTAAETGSAWARVLDVDLTGVFHVTQAALPLLLQRGGAVVNVSSIAALAGRPYLAAYSAAKGGVVALTRSLAVEYAHRGVRFCCVCPGSVDTPLAAGLQPPRDAVPELLARGRSLLEQQRASTDEVAAAIAYLGSDEARFATGTVLVLDGGALA